MIRFEQRNKEYRLGERRWKSGEEEEMKEVEDVEHSCCWFSSSSVRCLAFIRSLFYGSSAFETQEESNKNQSRRRIKEEEEDEEEEEEEEEKE